VSHFGAAALAAGYFLVIHPRSGIKEHTGKDADDEVEAEPPAAATELIHRLPGSRPDLPVVIQGTAVAGGQPWSELRH